MLTFYPGPSKIYPQVGHFLQDAVRDGVLSLNHRSAEFMDIMRRTLELFHERLNVPSDNTIYFTSSATECWEIVAQSLALKQSFHPYNGSFGRKWFDYTANIVNATGGIWFDPETNLTDIENLAGWLQNTDVVGITQNETSNGTQVSMASLQKIRAVAPHNCLLVLDATSSMAGTALDWSLGDVWLASVQKCFGLPPGLGIMVCSPRALARAVAIGDRTRYNSLLFVHQNAEKFQTHYTPNTLGIYLLMRVLEERRNIHEIGPKITARMNDFTDFVHRDTRFEPLIKNAAVRSKTVIALESDAETVRRVKTAALKNNIILGNGYGQWAETTIRIANFPAIDDAEFDQLKTFLADYQ